MPDATVVEREVADELQAARVNRSRERIERSVAAEQRVDVVKARGVVAVRAAGREEGREIEHVRAERLDVIEALLDTGQVAAEPLVRCVPAPPLRKLIPVAAHRPLGRIAVLAAR